MVAELVIHLGDHKTGTTALQGALTAGAIRIDGAAPFYQGPHHHRLALPLMPRNADLALARERLAEIGRLLDQSSAPTGVLSSEHFEYVAPERLAALIAEVLPQYRDRLRLVAYVRPHVDRFVASFAERTKMGLQTDLMEPFLDRVIDQGMLDYAPRFARWRRVFGSGFTLRPYLRDALVQGDVVSDFAAWLAQGRAWHLQDPFLGNESLSLADLSVLRMLQLQAAALPLPRSARGGMGWNLAEIMAATPDPGRVRLGIERRLAEQIVTRFAGDAAALDATYFSGGPMTRALQAAPERALAAAQSLAPGDCLTPAALRIADSAGGLLLRVAAADPARFAQAVRSPDKRQIPAAGSQKSPRTGRPAPRPAPGAAAPAAGLADRLGRGLERWLGPGRAGRVSGVLGRLTRPLIRPLRALRRRIGR